MVSFATPPHDVWAGQEDESWQQEGQPETDVLLSVDHTNLANQSTDVDEEVEVMVDSALSDGRINNHLLARWHLLDDNGSQRNLLNDKRRDIWLKTTSAETHDDKTEHENTKASALVLDDRWDGRHDQDDVTYNSDTDGYANSLVTTPVLICDVGAEERNAVYPEGVECVDTLTSDGTLAESTRDTLITAATSTGVVVARTANGRERSSNEVRVNDLGTIVGETFAKFWK